MLKFRHQHRHYSQVYIHDREVDLQDLGLAPSSWLSQVLMFMSSATQLIPAPSPQQNDLFSVLMLAVHDQKWLSVANAKLENFDLDLAVSALRQLSLTVALLPVSSSAKAGGVHHLRKWIKNFGIAKELPRFSRLNYFFKPPARPTSESANRVGMISDVFWSNNETPIGATEHESVSDLKRRLGLRIRSTLERVRNACIAELNLAERRSLALSTEMARHLVPELTVKLRELTVDKDGRNLSPNHPWVAGYNPMTLLASYYELMLESEREIAINERAIPIVFVALRGRDLSALLAEKLGPEEGHRNTNIQVALFNAINGNYAASVACMLIIQSYTGWNIGSILQLDEQRVKILSGNYEIQGFKTKTGDYTPTYFIDRNEHDLIRAVDFLRDRLASLKRLAWVPKDCSDLWIRARGPNHAPTQWITWNLMLKIFLKKHDLPPFTFSMVRNEVLAKEANDRGGIEAARHVGGHSSIATTGHYVDQLLLHRRNSSISLQFQRALQGSVEYKFKSGPTYRSATADLLYPVGDGTSCTNPTSPPFDSATTEGICDATRCHSGSGCPNNRIVINTQRLEELVRFRWHFESVWQRRLDENPDRFAKIDLPAWKFNEALRGVIAAGPYRHRLKRLEATLESKGGLM